LFASTSYSYDFGSAPDMYVKTYFDEDCDGTYESSGSTATYSDSYNPSLGSSSARTVSFDIDDDATSFCYRVVIFDSDATSDDVLDYVSGSGQYYAFTVSSGLSSSWTNTLSYDNTGSSESWRVGFDMDIEIG